MKMKDCSAFRFAVWIIAVFINIAFFGIGGIVTKADAEEIQSSIARGGVLYDKWYKETKAGTPGETHKSYPAVGKMNGGGTWRCKECHAWDYKGRDGAYSKGSHFTGIKGIGGMVDAEPSKIIAILKDSTHNYTDKMKEQDFVDIANFISNGQVDTDKYIDPITKKVKGGDINRGEAYYNTVCAKCHGKDGKEEGDEVLGNVASRNPWEFLHKVLNGQPGEKMPALRALNHQIILDIMAYTQTLPKEK